MAKLNTTIDNLELKSSKLGSNTDILPENWTDAQYPSAKLLYNNRREAHPIGSILVTSTNTDPADVLGGTWQLIDKTFKYAVITSPYQGYNSSTVADYTKVVLSDHTVSVRLAVTSSMIPYDSDVKIGTLLLDSCGLTAYPATKAYATPVSGSNITTNLPYEISTTGEIYSLKTTKPTTTGSTTIFIDITQPVDFDIMKDSFCDKFYWLRVA